MAQHVRLITFATSPAITIAQVRGHFAGQGLEVEVIVTPSSTEQMAGLGEGRYDIASTAFDNVLAWSGRDGRPQVVAVAQAAGGVALPIMVRPEIADWDDLRGKPLAVDAVDTAYALVLRRVLQAHGLELDRDYTFVAEGATKERFESLASRATYAAVLNPPWDQRAEDAGMKRMGDHRQVLSDYPGGVYAVSRPWMEANRPALTGFLRSLRDATAWAADPANATAAAQALVENGSTPQEAGRLLARMPRALPVRVEAMQVPLDLRVRFSLTPSLGPDLERYVDRSVAAELG